MRVFFYTLLAGRAVCVMFDSALWKLAFPNMKLCELEKTNQMADDILMEYNPNPSQRRVGDCAVRAVSKALGVDWETAYIMIAVQGYVMNDMPSSNAVWGAVLRQNGFNRYAIPNICPDCYTIEDFANDHKTGLYVVGTGNHVVTVKDGMIYDSWDSRKEIPQYFWKKEG